MKDVIIDKMKAELYDTRWCHADFEIDMKWLEGHEGPFLWMVRENGTALIPVDCVSINEMFESSPIRFSMFRDIYCKLLQFKMYANNKDVKYFYYDGYSIQDVVSYLDLENIFVSIVGDAYNKAKAQYPEEYEYRNMSLSVIYSNNKIKEDLKETLEFAKSIGDTSLQECLDNFKRYSRVSLNDYIEIGYDFADKSFSFARITDGKCSYNGGIIYHGYKNEKRWQIHT